MKASFKVQKSRRNFLKLILLGSGGLLLGKFLGSGLLSLFTRQSKDFQVGDDFKVVEQKNKLIFYNKKGTKIFTIDQEGTLEVGP
jgi:hypothetical protein